MTTLNLQKTSSVKSEPIDYEIIGGRKNVVRKEEGIFKTSSRAQIGHQTSILPSLDGLPIIDRSLIDYAKYHKYVGHAGRKYSMAMQATRGCPYKCFYCDIYKTTINHYRRSVDNIMEEVKMIYDMGIRRIEFVDDIWCSNDLPKGAQVMFFVIFVTSTLRCYLGVRLMLKEQALGGF